MSFHAFRATPFSVFLNLPPKVSKRALQTLQRMVLCWGRVTGKGWQALVGKRNRKGNRQSLRLRINSLAPASNIFPRTVLSGADMFATVLCRLLKTKHAPSPTTTTITKIPPAGVRLTCCWTIIGESLASGRLERGRERKREGEGRGRERGIDWLTGCGFVSFRQISSLVSQNVPQFWLLQQFVRQGHCSW